VTSELFTNSPHEPRLAKELEKEIASADAIDLVCAFVKWSGLRLIRKALADHLSRGKKLRVVTTTYCGATERRALDELVALGAEVKVTYELRRTRLHAKAWLLERESGFSTAFVGSSNLSSAALLDGLEWNVRMSGTETPPLLEKFRSTFESYWADPAFESYDPLRDGTRLDEALKRAGGTAATGAGVDLSGLMVSPFPHQEKMLYDLEVERRVFGHPSSLLVAATGTGKTVVAAFDFKRLLLERPGARLLFVAHRKEILEQACSTYRAVLGDASFGELMVDGQLPTKWAHVFASIQSLAARGVTEFEPTQFDVVVVDEFHHAEAPTYKALLGHLRPWRLLGMTATPERGDGVDVSSFFAGRVASELRVWDALEEGLLTPFQYFGVADGVDLSGLSWKAGRYAVPELEAKYNGNGDRLRIVLTSVSDLITDPAAMRAIGFCVSVEHARFMTAGFNAAGISARSLTGKATREERHAAVTALRAGEVSVIFTVDLFNEGVDIPEVDTLLMLRPTESATVFLQQLGRGLRLHPGKDVLTVLDFIGAQNASFRFDRRLGALTGSSRGALLRGLAEGFDSLPQGCHVRLDRVSQAVVLASVKAQVAPSANGLADELRRMDLPAPTLAAFLKDSGRELEDVYRSRQGWTQCMRRAGVGTKSGGAHETDLLKRVSRFLHVDDLERVEAYRALLSDQAPRYEALDERGQTYARMMLSNLWRRRRFTSWQEGLDDLSAEEALRSELTEVLDVNRHRLRRIPVALPARHHPRPLQVHAHYSTEELAAGSGYATLDRVAGSITSGVIQAADLPLEVLLVTLVKEGSTFSKTNPHLDHAISATQFSWQTQDRTARSSEVGKRYADPSHDVLLVSRLSAADEVGGRAAFTNLGLVKAASLVGDNPITITWDLEVPMSPDVFTEMAIFRPPA
jgi:superfamily II DNA or RNA helicase/HKD family nuclease